MLRRRGYEAWWLRQLLLDLDAAGYAIVKKPTLTKYGPSSGG